MKDGIKHIIGKTITSVVVGSNHQPPNNQVFLIFSDGTSFEFWGNTISCAGGLDMHDLKDTKRYIKQAGGTVNIVYS